MAKRSKSGCITCKIRRVKCDEARPECQKCVSSKRQCDGYLTNTAFVPRRRLQAMVQKLGVVGPISQALSICPGNEGDALIFNHYRVQTANITSSFLPSGFWSRSLLQLAHTEPALWHATVALGALHRRWDAETTGGGGGRGGGMGEAGDYSALTRRAEANYGRAMSLARSIESPMHLMALSVALSASSNMLSLWNDVHAHILAGLKLASLVARDTTTSTDDVDIVANMLRRMDMQAMTFTDSRAPYPYEEMCQIPRDDMYKLEGGGGRGGYYSEQNHPHTVTIPPFSSYDQAGSALFALLKRAMLCGNGKETHPATATAAGMDDDTTTTTTTTIPGGGGNAYHYIEQSEYVRRDLAIWEARTAELEKKEKKKRKKNGRPRHHSPSPCSSSSSSSSSTSDGNDDETMIPALALRIWHSWLRVILKATTLGPETRWDPCLPYFERMVQLARLVVREKRRKADRLREKRQRQWGCYHNSESTTSSASPIPSSSSSSSSSSTPSPPPPPPLLPDGHKEKKRDFSLEPALVVPLFSSAHRCRHPVLRRRALRLLSSLDCQEGMWRSDAAAAAIRVALEEEEGPECTTTDLEEEEEEEEEAGDDEEIDEIPWEAWSRPGFVLGSRLVLQDEHKEKVQGRRRNWAPERRRIREICAISHFEERRVDLKFLMASTEAGTVFGGMKDVVVRY